MAEPNPRHMSLSRTNVWSSAMAVPVHSVVVRPFFLLSGASSFVGAYGVAIAFQLEGGYNVFQRAYFLDDDVFHCFICDVIGAGVC